MCLLSRREAFQVTGWPYDYGRRRFRVTKRDEIAESTSTKWVLRSTKPVAARRRHNDCCAIRCIRSCG
jgi:hypothetical protein